MKDNLLLGVEASKHQVFIDNKPVAGLFSFLPNSYSVLSECMFVFSE